MKLFYSKSALFFLSLLVLLCYGCVAKDSAAGRVRHGPNEASAELANPPKADASDKGIVAKIGDYVITKEELEKRLMMALRPYEYDEYGEQTEPVDAKTVLLEMVAEKAMIMEARKRNLSDDEIIRDYIEDYREKQLVNLLLGNYLQGKITVTESEIDEEVKSNPKLSRAQAKATLQRAKANRILIQYYDEIYKKLHVKKLSENFNKAAQIRQRLLLSPKESRRLTFVRISQLQNELTPEEKGIVLATYDGGQVTLKDWFDTLCEMSPPRRPRDLHTVQGVERLLDMALRRPLFVCEATSMGFHKNENLLKQVKDREDQRLLGEVRSRKLKNIEGPADENQIIAYYNKNKERFRIGRSVRIDQIWCQDLETARKARAELDSGKDFESVKQKYSLQKEEPSNAHPGGEGFFFKDLWNADPNEIVGPIKGFYRGGFKWRIVRVLEKNPGTVQEYSNGMKGRIRSRITQEQRAEVLEKYRKELLQKYSYEIYDDRIRDIDPLNIP